MGSWKLEVFKMGIYMAFPVGLFYYFHQAEYFENWVIAKKRELYPPTSSWQKEEINKCVENMMKRREK